MTRVKLTDCKVQSVYQALDPHHTNDLKTTLEKMKKEEKPPKPVE